MSIDALLLMLRQEFGLVLFTAVSIVLILYLAYSMARPERF
ncbi:MAG: hypothetical protein ACREEC_01700 [Thermoplasmata archaeon]